jgi:N-acetylmuramoyl-L-alanine amidase
MDPGELFDWQRLARAGIGLWPTEADECEMDSDAILAMLGHIGYETKEPSATLKAFQRRFRPACINGQVDRQTARLIRGLVDCMEADSPEW